MVLNTITIASTVSRDWHALLSSLKGVTPRATFEGSAAHPRVLESLIR
jgi:hypothetical protein